MESFPANTLLSSSHTVRNGTWLPVLRPALSRALPPPSWHTDSDPPFIAQCPVPLYPHISFAHTHAHHGPPSQLQHPDSLGVYPSPPSGSSTSKPTIPLPEEAREFAYLYSPHLAGVLDSPPVMRRVDLASQKPLTPPPTMPHPTLNLPEAEVDMPMYHQDDEEVEEARIGTVSCSEPFGSPPQGHSDLPLSPLSPPCAQALSIPSSQDFPEQEHLDTLFSPCRARAPHALDYCRPSRLSTPEPSSLLEVDSDTRFPLLAPIGLPWGSSEASLSDPESPPASPFSSSLTSLIDYDELPPPSSPLISRLDLPDFEDDELPKVVPSSPSRRSYSGLPDLDIEMGDPTSAPALALSGHQLLSLPGADTDDELIPRIANHARPVPLTHSQPLLFIDDPRDVPLPRSPSPEDFDLCLSSEDMTDPELAQLFDLRKRSIAAERAARRLEALTEDVDLFTRAEARKIRKRERERSKEVGALLRLKLGDGVQTCPQEQSPESDGQHHARRRGGVIDTMSQLVAQMVFRRNETCRPLAKRKTPNTAREYVRSALSDGVKVDE